MITIGIQIHNNDGIYNISICAILIFLTIVIKK